MFFKLPIKINNKLVYGTFKITKNNNNITIENTGVNNMNVIDMIYKNEYGVNSYPVFFPLNIFIYKNYLVNEYFFVNSIMFNKDGELNFLYILQTKIEEYTKSKLSFLKINEYSNINLNNLIDFINSKNKNDILDSPTIFLNNIFIKLELYLNISLCIIYYNFLKKKFNPSTRINESIKKIYNFNILIFGREDTLRNHLNFIKNKEIKSDNYYFIKDKNKEFKVYIDKVSNNSITVNKKKLSLKNYELNNYPFYYLDKININSFLKILITKNIKSKIKNIVFKKKIYTSFLLFFENKNPYYLNNFKELKFKKFDIQYEYLLNPYFYCFNHISFENFIEIVNNLNSFNIDILKILLENYTYPLDYNKKTIALCFKKIIYYFFIHICDIEKNSQKIFKQINAKYKYILVFFIKVLSNIKTKNDDFIFNSKFYTDNLYFILINNLFNLSCIFTDKLFLNNCKKKFKLNKIIVDLINLLNWNDIKNKIPYLVFIINNKNKLILYEDKINKNILVNNLDSKFKKIILNPLYIFNYFASKKDFIKWISFFDDKYELFFNIKPDNINLLTPDILGKIYYNIKNIKYQDLNDKNYKKHLNFLRKYRKFIILNNRININLKEIINSDLNLGFLAKHMLVNDETITITEDNEKTVDELKKELKAMRKNYYKYKGKYLNLKISEIE